MLGIVVRGGVKGVTGPPIIHDYQIITVCVIKAFYIAGFPYYTDVFLTL